MIASVPGTFAVIPIYRKQAPDMKVVLNASK